MMRWWEGNRGVTSVTAIDVIKMIRPRPQQISGAGPAEAPPPGFPVLYLQRVEDGMLQELEAMHLFAMTNGITIPPDVVAMCGRAFSRQPGNQGADWMGVAPPSDTGLPGPDRPRPEADAAAGSTNEPTAPRTPDELSLLATAHNELAKLVAPAKPGTLVLLLQDERRHPFGHVFGAVPMARTMLIIAVISLVTLLGIALSGSVNAENVTKGLLNLYGYDLFVVEIFLAAAAGVGASLANLKILDRYISTCTYNERFDGSYWTRLVMGMISGILLSQVLYGAIASTTPQAPANSQNEILVGLGPPVLAVLGGFSAELVHHILTRLINAVRNVFGNDEPRPQPGQTPADR